MAQPAPGPPAGPRVVVEPDRDLLLGRAAQGRVTQRLHRPGRGPSSPAGLPAPLRADRHPVRLALHPIGPGPAAAPLGRPRAARTGRMTTTHELTKRTTKDQADDRGQLAHLPPPFRRADDPDATRKPASQESLNPGGGKDRAQRYGGSGPALQPPRTNWTGSATGPPGPDRRAAVTHKPATEGKSPTQAENDTARPTTRRLQW